MAITLVWRTDVHLSDRTPRSRKDNWTDTVIDKLRQVGEIAREVNADAVLDGGDFFDVKSPQRNSHSLVRQAAEAHKDYPCPVYANVGNHDCVYGDYSFLPQQPLGVLFATGVFKPCFNYDQQWFVDIHTASTVRIVGVPYHGTKYDLDRIANIRKGHEDFLVVMCHMLASPQGGSMFEGEDIIRYSDLIGHDANVFCFGHWHKDQGITEIAPGQHVVNVGSLTRGSLSQDDMDRHPSAVIMRFDKNNGVTFEKRPLTIQPALEVFDVEARTRQEERSSAVDVFVDSIRSTLVGTSGVPLVDLVRGATPDDAVREAALLYLEQA
jgi:DNA repair protein SbcD/Mre11